MLIDVHTHIYPRSLLDAMARRSDAPMVTRDDDGERLVIFPDEQELLGALRPISDAFYDVSPKLEFMDAAGIDKSIVSVGNPWVDPFEASEGAALASSLNGELSDLVCEHDSLEAIGVLPVQDPTAAVREIEGISKDSPLIGVMLGTRPGGGHVDDEHMDAVWASLERHGVPVFLHPHYAVGYDWMAGHGHAMPLALAFPFETTTAAMRMILGGVVDRYPDLQVILAHAGGTLPYLAGRLEACIAADGVAASRRKRGVEDYLRWFYYDSISYQPGPLRLLLSIIDPQHCMFGTDHPFGIADAAAGKRAIEEATPDTSARAAVQSSTAEHWIASGELPR